MTLVMPGRCRLLLPESATVPEWLHARTRGIGGSEVAALLGVSPYATAFDVFRAKVDDEGNPRFEGPMPEAGPKIRPELQTDNPILEWGHRLEEAVAQKTADELGVEARSGGGLWQHLDHEVAIVTPDRIAWDTVEPVALIECKTGTDAEEWVEEAPIHYQIQAQWQMGITGFTTCYLGCLILGPEREFFVKKIEFSAEWFYEMVDVAETFWSKHVLTGEPPMHDLVHPRTTDLLKDLHPHVIHESVEWDEDAAEWLTEFFAAKDELDTASTRFEAAKNWLKINIGDAGAAFIGDQRVVSYPEISSSRVSIKTLRAAYPEIADEVATTSTYRRLTVRPYVAPEDA